jgi:A predicted alpha-helical domain with a conserved ER motif.
MATDRTRRGRGSTSSATTSARRRCFLTSTHPARGSRPARLCVGAPGPAGTEAGRRFRRPWPGNRAARLRRRARPSDPTGHRQSQRVDRPGGGYSVHLADVHRRGVRVETHRSPAGGVGPPGFRPTAGAAPGSVPGARGGEQSAQAEPDCRSLYWLGRYVERAEDTARIQGESSTRGRHRSVSVTRPDVT